MNETLRETLGKALRDEWVEIKLKERTQGKHIPDDHILPWSALDERNKEIDRSLAEAVVKRYQLLNS
jgi:hypothetical protein